MVVPLLKLEFTQGPRAGDSLEFKPGSNVRIGRIVRGNDIAVKDAGISTKHLRIVSDSENWIIYDLGSSNGTFVNSETLDPDTPVNLRDGDIIKLGEYTSLVVKLVNDVELQEHKLPPRARRNNKRLAVLDPDPDSIEPVQDKPTRKGRSSKQDEQELPKRTRVSRQRNLKDVVDKDKELEVKNEIKVKARVGRPRKQQSVEIAKEEEVAEEENRNSRVQRSKKNTESVQKLGLNAVKLEVEDTPRGVEISEKKRATRSKQIGNACLEDKNETRPSRATRSKRTEIGGDSFMELEMVLNQARKSRAKRKKLELEPPKSEVDMETRNDEAEEEALQNRHVEEDKRTAAQESCCQRSDEREGGGSKRAEQVEVELGKKSTLGEDDLSCTVREDEETESLKHKVLVQEECRNTIDSKSEETGNATSNDGYDEEKVEQGSSNKNVEEVDLEKLTAREWLDVMEVQFPKHTSEETEKMIETMRSRALRIHKHIAEQKEKGL